MSTPEPTTAVSPTEGLRHVARLTSFVLHANVEGITQAESLAAPQPAGNCLNWVVGHLVCIGNKALPVVGQEPVVDPASLDRYDRGSAPLTDPAEARDIGELMRLWDEVAARMDAGLAGFPGDTLDQPAPFSPGNDPNETVGSLIATMVFHQSYHVGQTGVLRRVSGKAGAIK
ncbi:DinB family protein [Longimicrobium sp.]|uniref:DinB family protein n=1 Tax=Longimicrobium sp. TaxID=2029185 RepID=UPI002E33A6EB|nr:DinB family protein [Longimicrobium sp.]HEX6038930.1 DinB family protein [Longimicrobium sp.]